MKNTFSKFTDDSKWGAVPDVLEEEMTIQRYFSVLGKNGLTETS